MTTDTRTPLSVAFAPDFRDLGPYQHLLAAALEPENVTVAHLPGYRRVLPLVRALQGIPLDVLHLHYPVHYFLQYKKWDTLRKLRFPLDLGLATRKTPLVYTVHDLYPLDCPADSLVKADCHYAMKRASALIVHSAAAVERIVAISPALREKCTVIPHGDLSPAYGAPLPRAEARAQLGLEEGKKTCLVFGTITPNKGVEELIGFWKRERPAATLVVAGKPKWQDYARDLRAQAAGADISLRFEFQTNEQVRCWFSAVDCVIINYRTIFTSGVASLARSYGLPVVIPTRHDTVDLGEPHSSVFRFDTMDTDFGEKLRAALLLGPSYEGAGEWRKSISWDKIAAKTRLVYESVT